MLHVDSNIVSGVLADIDSEYGKIAETTITWGKIQIYLGMTIDYYSPVKVMFSMVNYIRNILDDNPEDIKSGSATPVAYCLFDVTEDVTKLSQTNIEIFYHFVAQLLYM